MAPEEQLGVLSSDSATNTSNRKEVDVQYPNVLVFTVSRQPADDWKAELEMTGQGRYSGYGDTPTAAVADVLELAEASIAAAARPTVPAHELDLYIERYLSYIADENNVQAKLDLAAQNAYIETQFGHGEAVRAMDAAKSAAEALNGVPSADNPRLDDVEVSLREVRVGDFLVSPKWPQFWGREITAVDDQGDRVLVTIGPGCALCAAPDHEVVVLRLTPQPTTNEGA